MRLLILILTLCGLAIADTGGLQSLPFNVGTDDILRSSNVVANGTFAGSTGWTLPGAISHDAAVTRTEDGSGSLRISNVALEVKASQVITPATYGTNRIFRLRVWLKASADPGAAATFRVYIFARGAAYGCGQKVSLSGLGDTWKEYTVDFAADAKNACSLFHHRSPHLDQNLTFGLYASNVPNDVNVWVDDVELRPVVRPLVIFPTYPNYRGMLWPDQGKTVKWNAVVDVPDGETLNGLTARVQVVRASDSNVMATVADTSLEALRASGVWGGYSVNRMEYDASGLEDGSYYLRGTLRRTSDDAQLYQYPDYKIVKEQPSVQRDNWKSWIDRYNRVVMNGTPKFIWGAYARFTSSRNTFVPGTGNSGSDPDNFRRLGNGCVGPGFGAACTTANPATTPWNRGYGLTGSTFIKQLADVQMNAITVYADFGTYTAGLETKSGVLGYPATGTISTSGTAVTGNGTLFGSEVLGPPAGGMGDVVRANGRTGTGTISAASHVVTGVGTVFSQELSVGDELCANGVCRPVKTIYSDTSARTGGTSSPSWSDHTFTINQYRKVVSVSSATSATISAPFKPDVSAASFAYEKCRTGGTRYLNSASSINQWITALQDYNIWYWHLVSNIVGTDSTYWSYANYHSRCNLLTREDAAHWITDFKPLGSTDGFFGFYISDEPEMIGYKGLNHAWGVQRGQQKANRGGVNFWVDGAAPRFAFDGWNNIVDSIQPDPYPASGDLLPTADDAAYGLNTWAKHGRSWHWPRRSLGSVFDARPVFPVIQLFNWYASQGYRYSTYPQVSDMKIQAISAIASGGSGILWWQMGSASGGLGDRDETAYVAWRRVAKYIARFLPILNEPVRDFADREDGGAEYGRIIASVSDPEIKCSSRQREDQILLACANTTNTDITATITLTQSIPGKVHVPWDASAIAPSGASFTYTFKGLNGGTRTAGTGTIASASGQTVTCSGCALLSEVQGQTYEYPTVTANTETRLVLSVESDSQMTIDSSVGTAWNNRVFTFSTDAEKQKAAEIFLISVPTVAAMKSAGGL